MARSFRQHAGDQIEGGGFASAIGANQAHNLPRPNVEADVIDRSEATELLSNFIDL